MRYSILAFAATAAAAPFAATGPSLCPTGLYSNPQCCATDVLGAVGLNCAVPATAPASVNDFISGCAATGQQAKCCVIPVADQDVLCQDVSPSPPAGGAPTPTGGAPAPPPTGNPGGPPAGPPGGTPSSSDCDSSAAPTPTKPAAPSPPAETDCGCDE